MVFTVKYVSPTTARYETVEISAVSLAHGKSKATRIMRQVEGLLPFNDWWEVPTGLYLRIFRDKGEDIRTNRPLDIVDCNGDLVICIYQGEEVRLASNRGSLTAPASILHPSSLA